MLPSREAILTSGRLGGWLFGGGVSLRGGYRIRPLLVDDAGHVEILIDQDMISLIVSVLQIKHAVIRHRWQHPRDKVEEKSVDQIGIDGLRRVQLFVDNPV